MIRSLLPQRLTFRFLPEAWPLVRHHTDIAPALKSVRPRHRIRTFYDTASGILSRHDWALSTAREGRASVQVLEPVSWAGLPNMTRPEQWVWSRRGLRPDIKLLEGTEAAELDLSGTVLPIYRTDFWQLQGKAAVGATSLKVTLSRGSVQAGEQAEAVCALDLTLLSGEARDLYAFAQTLSDLPIWLTGETLPMRGVRLALGQYDEDATVQSVLPFAGDMTVGKGWSQSVRSFLTVFLAAHPAAEHGSVDAVHEMRVAVRRLRTILKAFRPLLPKGALANEMSVFQQTGQFLGNVRDWDVFQTEILPAYVSKNIAAEFVQLAEEKRVSALAEMRQKLTDPSITSTLLSLGHSTEDPAALFGAETADALLEDHAPVLLDRMARKVQHRGHHIGHLSDRQLHDVRKSLKGLRYSIESILPLYNGSRVETYMGHCKDLQDLFGRFNDAATAEALVRQAIKERPDLAEAGDAIVHMAHRERKKILKKLPKRWKTFSKDVPFWCQ